MQEEGDEGNVDALLRTLKAIINVFKTLDWVMEKGWSHIPRKWSKEDAINEASNSNIVNKVSGKKYSNYFPKALNASKLMFL
jgi:hypothetical protein